MGDNGFSDFKKPDPSPFRLFCEDTFLNVFGNSNASHSGVQTHKRSSATESAAITSDQAGASELLKRALTSQQADNAFAELHKAGEWLSEKRGTCDCCSSRPWTHRIGAHQTSAQCETFACCECANCDGECGD